jgi:hypothetical protein
MITKKWIRVWIASAVLLLALPALAQDSGSTADERNWGFRLGLGSNPDQIIVGGQYDFGEIARRVHIDPHFELGFGDDSAILSGTAAFLYVWDRKGTVQPYVGGGPEIGVVWVDHPNGSDTDFEIAIKAMGGGRWQLKSGNEFFLELDVIFGDLHDVQFMVGWRF